ncbi:site-specific integrase [Clostridium thermarum]|nr:site-specific integrase [Clostridium thermarum]
MLHNNPTDNVKPPQPKDYEIKVWDAETSSAFLEAIKNESIYLPVLIALQTGMREGEVCALKWDSIDLERKNLYVKHTLKRDSENEIELKAPKTKRSKRNIKLMDETVKELRHQKNIHRLNKIVLGKDYKDDEYVCAWPDGRVIDPHYVCSRFVKLVKKYGFPELTFHGLRHTHATLLLLAGVHPKVVSERLGHSSITITLDLYSHVLPDMQQEAVDKLSLVLNNKKQSSLQEKSKLTFSSDL